jgi:tRNA (adenine37-N6)-methyltransferase
VTGRSASRGATLGLLAAASFGASAPVANVARPHQGQGRGGRQPRRRGRPACPTRTTGTPIADAREDLEMQPIGHVRVDAAADLPVASQASEAAAATARVELDDALAPGLLGLDRYRWVWLLTLLHDQPTGPVPLQLVPRATEATGEVQGVFASRAPQRPNPIGLSLVELLGVEGTVIRFRGVDLLDGTPVLDVKPWFADCDVPSPGAGT